MRGVKGTLGHSPYARYKELAGLSLRSCWTVFLSILWMTPYSPDMHRLDFWRSGTAFPQPANPAPFST
jgi:hypothetical protein